MRRQMSIRTTTPRGWVAAVISALLGLACANYLIGQEFSILDGAGPRLALQDPQPAGPVLNVLGDDLPPPNQEPEEIELLMRAPLHEAFAEVVDSGYEPSPLVNREPPEPIEELPPEYKPEGENVVWISGYWHWDDERDNFIWISGVWRDTPPGKRWVPGYWANEGSGYRWVRGFWIDEQVEELVYLPAPPEPLEVGPSSQAPSQDYFYTPGTWVYRDARYVWQPGHYAPFVEDILWVPPTYIWTPSGYIFRPGYWDRPFDCRGTVFAPVAFRRPIARLVNFLLRPRCVIDTGFGLFPHLFVRRGRPFYYFGDFYDPRFVGGGFCPWSNIGNFGFYHRQFDPLFCYYGSPFVSFQNTSVISWAHSQHLFFAQNANFRPPVVFNLNIVNQRINNNLLINNFNAQGFPQGQVFLADTIDRRAREPSPNQLAREVQRFVRLTEQQQRQEQAAFERDLARQRRELEKHVRQTARTAAGNAVTASPARVKLPAEVRQAETAAQRVAREAERAAQRAQVQAALQQKQAEAAARAEARRGELQQKRVARDAENEAREAQRSAQRSAQEQARQQKLAETQNRIQQQREQRQADELTRRAENAERKQEREAQVSARQKAIEDFRAAQLGGRKEQTQERAQQRQIEQQQQRAAEAARQQMLQQQRAAEAAARQQQAAQRKDQIQERVQQRQIEQQQQRAAEAARQQMLQQQRAAEAAMRQQQQAAQQQQRQMQMQQQRAADAARQAAAQQQRAAQQQALEQQRMQRQMERQNRNQGGRNK